MTCRGLLEHVQLHMPYMPACLIDIASHLDSQRHPTLFSQEAYQDLDSDQSEGTHYGSMYPGTDLGKKKEELFNLINSTSKEEEQPKVTECAGCYGIHIHLRLLNVSHILSKVMVIKSSVKIMLTLRT